MQRKNWIDWAKALGILLVVMGHSKYSCPHLNEMIFMVHMPIFFVASGYLFNTSKTLIEITKSNIKTLLIPYIFFNGILLIYLSAGCLVKSLVGGLDADWGQVVLQPSFNSLLGIPGNLLCGPTWFLLALIWCKYIIYAIEKVKVIWKIVMLFLWGTVFVLIQIFQPNLPLAFNAGITGCLWFGIGYYIKKYSDALYIPKIIWVLLIPVSFFACLYVCRLQGNCNYLCVNVKGVLGVLGTAAGLISFYAICKLLDVVHSMLVIKVSSATIAIMCLHMLIMPNLEKLTHYQNHMLVTFIGDLSIVVLLTLIYPVFQKYAPMLVGRRK